MSLVRVRLILRASAISSVWYIVVVRATSSMSPCLGVLLSISATCWVMDSTLCLAMSRSCSLITRPVSAPTTILASWTIRKGRGALAVLILAWVVCQFPMPRKQRWCFGKSSIIPIWPPHMAIGKPTICFCLTMSPSLTWKTTRLMSASWTLRNRRFISTRCIAEPIRK